MTAFAAFPYLLGIAAALLLAYREHRREHEPWVRDVSTCKQRENETRAFERIAGRNTK